MLFFSDVILKLKEKKTLDFTSLQLHQHSFLSKFELHAYTAPPQTRRGSILLFFPRSGFSWQKIQAAVLNAVDKHIWIFVPV